MEPAIMCNILWGSESKRFLRIFTQLQVFFSRIKHSSLVNHPHRSVANPSPPGGYCAARRKEKVMFSNIG